MGAAAGLVGPSGRADDGEGMHTVLRTRFIQPDRRRSGLGCFESLHSLRLLCTRAKNLSMM